MASARASYMGFKPTARPVTVTVVLVGLLLLLFRFVFGWWTGAITLDVLCNGTPRTFQLDSHTAKIDLEGCGLTSVPTIDWCRLSSLKTLDLSGNDFAELPESIGCAKGIQRMFVSYNPRLGIIPSVVAQLPLLRVYAQRSSQVSAISATDFPQTLQWLILTGNTLSAVPDLSALPIRKLMLSHNQISSLGLLPQTLEILRVSNNKLAVLPAHLDELPVLTWVAFSSNPFGMSHMHMQSAPQLDLHKAKSSETLATNQGKKVIKSTVRGAAVAIKFFGTMDTDGLAMNEVMINGIIGDSHQSMMHVLGIDISDPESPAVAFEFLEGWSPLGGRPDFDSMTRDTFKDLPLFTTAEIVHSSTQIASAMRALHELNIAHGDLYCHNIMVQDGGVKGRGDVKLGDFGGATRYPNKIKERVLRWEARAFGRMIEDMLSWAAPVQEGGMFEEQLRGRLRALKDAAISSSRQSKQPDFGVLMDSLELMERDLEKLKRLVEIGTL